MNQIYKKTVLDNGLRLITHSMPGMQSVALGIWIKVGGRYESKVNKGISHFMEHLAFKGTKSYSCRKLKESLEGVGGALNGFTSEELTCYLVKIPARYLDLALNILSDMVINPLIPQEEVDKERTVIMEEIKMYKDLPQSYVYDLLDELLWPDQPLGLSIAGTADSVGKINKRELYAFKEKYYTPVNIVVSVAGVFIEQKLNKKIEDIFSSLKHCSANKFLAVTQRQRKPQLNIFDKATEQTHMALGFHGFKRGHPLRHAATMLHIILGANMSSRLFNEVREKRGLAYEIGTQVKRFYDTGAFLVHAGIDNRKVHKAIKVILMELAKIKNEPVSESEFRRAREFLLGQLRLALEDTLDHMFWIGEATATLDKTYSLEEIIKEVSKVSKEDIQAAAKDILKEKNLNLALIGPLKDGKEAIYRQLHL